MDLSLKESFYRSKSTRVLILLGFQVDRCDRQTGRCCQTGYTVQTGLFDLCQFWSSTYAPLFFGDASMPKNKLLGQNYLRMMINMHRSYFILRAINSIGRILLLQADDETTCLDLHTCFMVANFAGSLVQSPLVVP